MEYLLEKWESIEQRLHHKSICLFLDFDGTLSPISATPSEALLPETTKRKLECLAKSKRCQIAIISGRQMSDLKKQVGIEGIGYSGNHGLELETANGSYKKSLPPTYSNDILALKEQLKAALLPFQGVAIEDKALSLSIHYRLLPNEQFKAFQTVFNETVSPYLQTPHIAITPGKMVFEIRPNIPWNKGSATLRYLKEYGFAATTHLPFYFGDDTSDEDAFKVLAQLGIAVKVGEATDSHAQYYVKDPQEVVQCLDLLIEYLVLKC